MIKRTGYWDDLLVERFMHKEYGRQFFSTAAYDNIVRELKENLKGSVEKSGESSQT